MKLSEQLVQADLEMRRETEAIKTPQVDLQRLMGRKLLVPKRTVRKHADWFEKNRALLRLLVLRKLDEQHWQGQKGSHNNISGVTKQGSHKNISGVTNAVM